MKKLIALLLFICMMCSICVSCAFEQSTFVHSLKTGRYRTDEVFTIGDLEITYFELELTDGDKMKYVKTDGESMIKDLSMIDEQFPNVLDVKLTMCINGETETFRFESAKALNRKTETEYMVSGLTSCYSDATPKYPDLDGFTMTTIDGDGDGVAEKLKIKMSEVEFSLENNDVLYKFTLQDNEGVFGTEGILDLTYYDYQTVELRDYDVTSFTHDGSNKRKYRMPIITMSSGEVLTPILVKADNNNSVDYWLISFPMSSHDINGVVSQIDVADSEINQK